MNLINARTIFVLFFTSFSTSLGAQTSEDPRGLNENYILDQVVVEIDKVIYTQRQVASYTLVSAILTGNTPSPIGSEEAWQKAMKRFCQDFVMLHESQRLGRFLPTREAIDTSYKKAKQKLSQTPILESEAQRLALNEKSLERLITLRLQVEGYENSKPQGQTSFEEWIIVQMDKAMIRIIDHGFKNLKALR